MSARQISTALGGQVRILDWQQTNSSFVNAVEIERNVMFLILTLIIVVAAFNIISGMIMMVKDKGRDIAILRTMGATRGMILRIFILSGASIGVVGTLAGLRCSASSSPRNIEAIRQFVQSMIARRSVLRRDLFLHPHPGADRSAARSRRSWSWRWRCRSSRRSTRPGARRGSIRSRRCATNERHGAERRRSNCAEVRRVFRQGGVELAVLQRRRSGAASRARWWRWSGRRAPASRRCCISPGCWSGRMAARC